jgi:hypothetical protein
MKTIRIVILAISLLFIESSVRVQSINWGSLQKNERHIININSSLEYGWTFGLGYGYQLKTDLPIVLNAEYSFPGGNILVDDFKTKIGGQTRVAIIGNFLISAKVHGVFRRYENSLTTLVNFGSDMSAAAGYYRRKWHIAAEVGFDKAIVTHFKHSEVYKRNFPEVQDGWYEPATGGNFYYGVQAGFSFKHHDIYLKAGKTVTQDFKTTPLIPFYAQVGYNFKLK